MPKQYNLPDDYWLVALDAIEQLQPEGFIDIGQIAEQFKEHARLGEGHAVIMSYGSARKQFDISSYTKTFEQISSASRFFVRFEEQFPFDVRQAIAASGTWGKILTTMQRYVAMHTLKRQINDDNPFKQHLLTAPQFERQNAATSIATLVGEWGFRSINQENTRTFISDIVGPISGDLLSEINAAFLQSGRRPASAPQHKR